MSKPEAYVNTTTGQLHDAMRLTGSNFPAVAAWVGVDGITEPIDVSWEHPEGRACLLYSALTDTWPEIQRSSWVLQVPWGFVPITADGFTKYYKRMEASP